MSAAFNIFTIKEEKNMVFNVTYLPLQVMMVSLCLGDKRLLVMSQLLPTCLLTRVTKCLSRKRLPLTEDSFTNKDKI